MALTNPTKLVNVQELQYFEGKLAAKYQTKAVNASGITAQTVEGALEELATAISSLPSAIVPKGTKAFAGLAPSTDLVVDNLGHMWNISDAFTTTSDFAEGAGHSIPAGANVYVANVGTAQAPSYKYDIFQGMYDLSGYKTKQTAVADADATTEGSGTTFVDSVEQNANGEITVHKKTVDMSAKADKVSGAVAGNFAGLDANGNLTDSGSKAADFQPAGSYKTTQTVVNDPSASGNALAFIDSITQNANGEITATKKNVEVAADSDIDEIFA